MSVFRINKTKNYTIMSNSHFKEKGMSLKAKGLLSLMLSLPDDWSYNISGLVKLSKDGRDSVMSALGELEEFGYLRREQLVDDKGRFAGIEYHIYEEPQTENTFSEKPTSDNQKSANPTLDNREQLNTNNINNLKNKDIKESNTNKNISESEMYEILMDKVDDTDLQELYIDYVMWRAETDAPLTKHGFKMLISRCERLSDFNVSVQKAMVETALIQGWKNVFKPKPEELKGRNDVLEEHGRILFGGG